VKNVEQWLDALILLNLHWFLKAEHAALYIVAQDWDSKISMHSNDLPPSSASMLKPQAHPKVPCQCHGPSILYADHL
jgi:hypothetical protein